MSAGNQTDDLELRWRDVPVATLHDAVVSDGVWFARTTMLVASTETELVDFVRFCVDWNERARTSTPDPAEFDRFGTLFTPGIWAVITRDGTRRPLRVRNSSSR